MPNKETFKQFLGYFFNGCCAASTHYSILFFLVEVVKINPVSASAVGFCAGLIVGYTLNSKYVFFGWQSDANTVSLANTSIRKKIYNKHAKSFGKYVAVNVVGISINVSILWLLLTFTKMHYMLAQILATIVILAWNFSFFKLWVFRKKYHAN